MRPPWQPDQEIVFAGRSGFLTKRIWRKHFAGDSHASWINKKWNLMKNQGYFFDHPSSLSEDVLIPNPNSFLVQRLCPGGVFRSPFIAQLRHDETMFDGLLSLQAQGFVRDFVTEGELKKAESTGFSTAREPLKLPDLLITTEGGISLAVEIELTQKSKRRYWAMLNAYRMRRDVNAILFVVPNRAVISAILAASRAAMFPQKEVPFGFMSAESWLACDSKRPMTFAEKATTLREVMRTKQSLFGA